MSSTPKFLEEALGESWVDLNSHYFHSPGRVTPPFVTAGEEYLRLLREAQKDSNHSSARVSRASSNFTSLRGSPKSPPNSPNTEPCVEENLKDVYINYYSKDGEFVKIDKSTDWIWDWSSKPDQNPPKDWKFKHPKRLYELVNTNEDKAYVFSKEMFYTLIITNLLSLIIGTGVGMWLTRRTMFSSNFNFD